MTYKEAKEKALTVPWDIRTCHTGTECWCRCVFPEMPIEYTDFGGNDYFKDEVCIISAGSVDKATAEHIVRIHNLSLTNT